jgi:hypothetical protein
MPRSSVDRALKNLSAGNVMLVTWSSAEGLYYGEPATDGTLARLAVTFSNGASRSQARKDLHRLERERRVNVLMAAAIAKEEGGK